MELSIGVFLYQGSYYIVAIVGFIALAGGAYHLWTLRNLAEEVDKFSHENARLEETAGNLETQVVFLGTKKDELTGHVNKLEGTVGDLKGVSEGLQHELVQFESVQVSDASGPLNGICV